MEKLVDKINSIKNTSIREEIKNRLKEFKNVDKESTQELFKELYYCILTARSSAVKCIEIQNKIGDCFQNLPEEDISKKLKDMGYHFHNRAKYISKAYEEIEKIKDTVNSFKDEELRNWIIKNVKGLGAKEASHFLRNIGLDDYAIIDSHILNILEKYKLIEKPKLPLNKKQYLEIENLLKSLAEKTNTNLAELDLYLWYLDTDKVLK